MFNKGLIRILSSCCLKCLIDKFLYFLLVRWKKPSTPNTARGSPSSILGGIWRPVTSASLYQKQYTISRLKSGPANRSMTSLRRALYLWLYADFFRQFSFTLSVQVRICFNSASRSTLPLGLYLKNVKEETRYINSLKFLRPLGERFLYSVYKC